MNFSLIRHRAGYPTVLRCRRFTRMVGVFALLTLPLAVQAQTLTLTADGVTAGDQGLQFATVAEGGINPRIIALESFQDGDTLPPVVHLKAKVLGSGYAAFGALGGNLEAQAENQAGFANPYTPYGEATIRSGFTDSLIVSSSTLAVGASVTIPFPISLASAVIATGPRTFGFRDNGAGATVDFEIRDENTGARVFAFFANNSTDTGPPLPSSRTLMLTTAVGNLLTVSGDLRLGVSAIAPLTAPSGGTTLATSAVVADHTARLYYQPQDGITLISASGHDYAIGASNSAAPEPGTFALLSLGGLLALRRGIHRRS